MYKLIACDMDETLLNDQREISPKTVVAIKKASQAGVYFVPNTGRNFLTIQDNLETLDLVQKPDQYVISFNGATIVENKDLRVVDVQAMPYDVVKQLFEIGLKAGVCIHVYTVSTLYMWNVNQGEIDYLAGRVDGWEEPTQQDIAFLKDEPITKIIFNIDEEAKRHEMHAYVEEHVKTPLNITYSSDRYIEFNDPTADKGQAVVRLGEILGIKPSEIIAIGDNGNDLSMIKAAGLGVCVANGRDFVKQEANYVTSADNNHDAIAEVINKFIFNEE